MLGSRVVGGKPGAPTRKLVIKPLKAPPRPPDGFEDEAWVHLSNAIDAIHDLSALEGSNNSGGVGGKGSGKSASSKTENSDAKKPNVPPSYETLYRSVEDVCIYKKAGQLFDRLHNKLTERIAQSVSKLKQSASVSDEVTFLKKFDSCWNEHTQSIKMVQKIFLYLDKAYVSSMPKGPRSLWDVSTHLFRNELLGESWDGVGGGDEKESADEIRRRIADAATARASGRKEDPGKPSNDQFDCTSVITTGLLLMIKKERNGEVVDRFLLKRVTRAFVGLKIYAEKFEPKFLKHLTSHYSEEGDSLFGGSNNSMTPFEYLKHCEVRLGEEADRCDAVLDVSTKRSAVQAVTQNLLENHLPQCLDKGFTAAFKNNQVEDVKRFYLAAKRCGGGGEVGVSGAGGNSSSVGKQSEGDTGTRNAKDEKTPPSHGSQKFVQLVKKSYSNALREIGLEIVKDTTREKDMVQRCLSLKTQTDCLLIDAFESNEQFIAATRESFEHFINATQNRPAELLAKFIDAQMKGTGGSMGNHSDTTSEINSTESSLDGALTIFRHVHGKDVFEAFYKKDLAKRLLLGKSASIDSEKSMIGKLKQECGAQFTAKLEGMFKDVEISRDVMRGFEEKKGNKGEGKSAGLNTTSTSPEAYVNVLTAGLWPTYNAVQLNLPKELEQLRNDFTEFYLSKHSGRKLAWLNGLGHCVLKAKFPKGEKELMTSTFQAAVLLLFNDLKDGATLSTTDIKESTGMEDNELRRTLQSLACGKVRVLTKTPKGREVEDDDTFQVNDTFSERLFRVKINSIQLKETKEEVDVVHENVAQDRQYQIDACVVRIMKTRKTLSHQLLTGEVFSQIQFPAKPSDLKKRIESLIEREYLERDRNDPQVYNYLA